MPGIAIANSMAFGVSPPPWTPASVPGCILYGGAYAEARATRAAQPVLVDGDMEAAGTAAWTAAASTTLSKQGDAYAGAQCLRVANAGAVNRYVSQLVGGITGNRYRITGAARGDGAARPAIGFGSAGYDWNGTTSGLWQPIANDYNWTTFGLYLYSVGADTKYTEFDSLTLANLSLASYTPLYTTIPGSVLAQATPTAQPWVSSDGLGIRYQGGDLLQWSAAASAVKCLHDGTGGTLIVAVRPNSASAAWFASTFVVDFTKSGFAIAYDSSSFLLYMGNSSGAAALEAIFAGPIVAGATNVITLRTQAGANGIDLRLNGSSKYTGTIANPSAADPQYAIKFGAHTAGNPQSVDGIVGHPFVANRVLTDAECTAVENYILAQATL